MKAKDIKVGMLVAHGVKEDHRGHMAYCSNKAVVAALPGEYRNTGYHIPYAEKIPKLGVKMKNTVLITNLRDDGSEGRQRVVSINSLVSWEEFEEEVAKAKVAEKKKAEEDLLRRQEFAQLEEDLKALFEVDEIFLGRGLPSVPTCSLEINDLKTLIALAIAGKWHLEHPLPPPPVREDAITPEEMPECLREQETKGMIAITPEEIEECLEKGREEMEVFWDSQGTCSIDPRVRFK